MLEADEVMAAHDKKLEDSKWEDVTKKEDQIGISLNNRMLPLEMLGKSIQSSGPKGPEDRGIGLQDLEGCSGKAGALVLLGQAQVCLSTQLEKATRSERNSC